MKELINSLFSWLWYTKTSVLLNYSDRQESLRTQTRELYEQEYNDLKTRSLKKNEVINNLRSENKWLRISRDKRKSKYNAVVWEKAKKNYCPK